MVIPQLKYKIRLHYRLLKKYQPLKNFLLNKFSTSKKIENRMNFYISSADVKNTKFYYKHKKILLKLFKFIFPKIYKKGYTSNGTLYTYKSPTKNCLAD